MKRWWKSWRLMALALSVILNPLCAFETGAATPSLPQRARQASKRVAASPLVPAGSQVLPADTVLIVRMETRLDSKTSRPSDRFTAKLIEPVKDAAGKVVVPAGSLVEGHVASVTPAQLRRRSGVIAVGFDRLRLLDGRSLPMHGVLTSADPRERQRIDEEGQVKGGGTGKRTVAFIGGGAAGGAATGAIIGGVILSAGIGAAVGVAAAWLAKGKEAVVERGKRIGVQLSQPLNLNPVASKKAPSEEGETKGMKDTPPTSQPTEEAVLVRVSGVLAERMPDGAVQVVITAETNTAGWRVYADHTIDRETLEIWLRGLRPKGMAAQVISHPTSTVRVPDAAKAIRRVIVHGANGERTAELPSSRGK